MTSIYLGSQDPYEAFLAKRRAFDIDEETPTSSTTDTPNKGEAKLKKDTCTLTENNTIALLKLRYDPSTEHKLTDSELLKLVKVVGEGFVTKNVEIQEEKALTEKNLSTDVSIKGVYIEHVIEKKAKSQHLLLVLEKEVRYMSSRYQINYGGIIDCILCPLNKGGYKITRNSYHSDIALLFDGYHYITWDEVINVKEIDTFTSEDVSKYLMKQEKLLEMVEECRKEVVELKEWKSAASLREEEVRNKLSEREKAEKDMRCELDEYKKQVKELQDVKIALDTILNSRSTAVQLRPKVGLPSDVEDVNYQMKQVKYPDTVSQNDFGRLEVNHELFKQQAKNRFERIEKAINRNN